jgi:hypothetical protein
MTQITDRSLEMLGGMASLEQLEFRQCAGLTDAGVAHLSALPRLGRIEIYGSPKVSPSVRELFGDGVQVRYSG